MLMVNQLIGFGAAAAGIAPDNVARIPTMSAATNGAVAITSSDEQATYPSWKCCDGSQPDAADSDYASLGTPSGGSPIFWNIDLGTARIIQSYEIGASGYVSLPNLHLYMMDDWTLRGANASDYSDEVVLDTISGESAFGVGENRVKNITNQTAYRYWRFRVTSTVNNNLLAIGKIQLYT